MAAATAAAEQAAAVPGTPVAGASAVAPGFAEQAAAVPGTLSAAAEVAGTGPGAVPAVVEAPAAAAVEPAARSLVVRGGPVSWAPAPLRPRPACSADRRIADTPGHPRRHPHYRTRNASKDLRFKCPRAHTRHLLNGTPGFSARVLRHPARDSRELYQSGNRAANSDA